MNRDRDFLPYWTVSPSLTQPPGFGQLEWRPCCIHCSPAESLNIPYGFSFLQHMSTELNIQVQEAMTLVTLSEY